MIFGAGQRRACYNQSIVNDELPEPNESFIVRIVDNPDITVGTPGVSQINIIDDDGSEFSESITGSVTYMCLLHSESVTLKSNTSYDALYMSVLSYVCQLKLLHSENLECCRN